ncbi:MAG: methylenetetrahydrofolate reductase [Rhodoplanes sp.]
MSDIDTVAAHPGDAAAAARLIAGFLRGVSFETTRLAAADLAAAKDLGGDVSVYISAIPRRPAEEQIAVAAALRAHGVEPIPHIAVREFASVQALAARLARLVEQASVRRVLIIAGDRAEPAGPFHAAIELIESGLLQDCGIQDIGIAGYPDGHPRIAPLDLDRALAAKIEAAGQTGLRVHVVTQFAFAAEPILGWLARLRDLGIDNPVRIGFAGPATLTGLLRFARICGVKTSAQALARNAGLARNMFARTTPDRLVRPIAEACANGQFGEVTPHLYSFGGLAATIRWAAAVAAGRIELDRAGGFSVTPP